MQLVYARTDGGTAALAASRHACFVSHSLRHSHRGCWFRGLAAARVPWGSLILPLRAGLACTCAMGLGRLTPTITQTDHGHTAHSSHARRGRSSQPSGLGRGSGARLEAKRYKSKKPWRSFLIAHIPVCKKSLHCHWRQTCGEDVPGGATHTHLSSFTAAARGIERAPLRRPGPVLRTTADRALPDHSDSHVAAPGERAGPSRDQATPLARSAPHDPRKLTPRRKTPPKVLKCKKRRVYLQQGQGTR